MNESTERRGFLKKDLFTVNQVSKVCGISRSTILRMEDRGLLTPAYCDKKSGYRYYDNHNIAKLMQIKSFQEMGLQYNDIAEYYNSSGDPAAIAEKLEKQMFVLKRALEEMKLRIEDENHLTAEIINMPDYVCYAREYSGTSLADRYRDMYNLYHEACEKGYRPLAAGPLFIINKRDDFFDCKFRYKETYYICCLPLEPDCASDEAVAIPGGKMLSVLHYGNYGNFNEVYDFLSKKVREMNLKPAGYPRTLGLVAPYTGREIKPSKYVTRLVLPVE